MIASAGARNGRSIPASQRWPATVSSSPSSAILRTTCRNGRALWKHWTGYHVQNGIEAKLRCLKVFGERIAARDPNRQTAEIQLRIAVMNRFSALGTAEIVRVA